MTLRQLEIFRAVLRLGTLSGAAAELHLTQPAVSMQMKALAKDVGVALFRSTGRRLEGTEAGRIFDTYAERILRLADEARMLASLEVTPDRVVRIAASSTPGVNLLPARVAAHRKRHPEVAVRLEVLNSEEVESRVASGEADFGIVGGQLKNAGLRADRWCDDELVLVLPSGHRLARRRAVSARDLAGEVLLVREHGSATRSTAEAAFLKAGLPLPVVQVVGNTEAIKGSVSAGLGISLLSRYAVNTEVRSGLLAAVRLKDVALSRPLRIVRDPKRELTPAARGFLRFLSDSVRRKNAPEQGTPPA
jgi:DNA-binding transcriptional LysR family regulator